MNKFPVTLPDWIKQIGKIHPQTIQLGLDRIAAVAGGLKELDCPVITVAGTNGKGTTVCTLESIYRAAGYRTGLLTSPFLFHYQEQIKIQGEACSAQAYCEAFSEIEVRRGDVLLTQFEFLTLAALYLFKKQPLDVIILEVGLGGRLDAVNVVDPDISLITNISLDHIEYLGETREKIATEKAGILRPEKPFVYAEKNMPQNLIKIAEENRSPLYWLGRDFRYDLDDQTWYWQSAHHRYFHLPKTHLHLDNIAGALMVIDLMQTQLPVSLEHIQNGIQQTHVPGRVEVVSGEMTKVFDVSHNPASIAFLAKKIQAMPISGKIIAVFSMLGDKDLQTSIKQIQDLIDEWYIAPIQHPRACSINQLKKIFQNIGKTHFFSDLKQAYQAALNQAVAGDCIVVFGSFHTVAEVYRN